MKLKNLKRGRYKTYDPELRRVVSKTRNLELAIKNGVPRTTAIYWINQAKGIESSLSSEQAYLEDEIKKLHSELVVERAKVQYISALSQYLSLIRNSKKRLSRSMKKKIILKIDSYKKYCSVSELLSLIGLHTSRYYKWRSELERCNQTNKFECAVKRINQLTGDEVSHIIRLASSKKYQHFSLTALWKFAYRNAIVVCSKDTWFKYINRHQLNRKPAYYKKLKYQDGLRAVKPNLKWHLDLTEYELLDGSKVYLQAIIDNCSRYIVDWSISEDKKAQNTAKLIQRAKAKLKSEEETDIVMDSGTENKNKSVEMIFLGSNIKQIFAKVDIKYSNSMVEAFFRSIKNNYLYKKAIKTLKDFKRAVTFYIKQHNDVIPHSCFEFSTPKEKYFDTWGGKNNKYISEIKEEAVLRRKINNLNIQRCSQCLV